MNFLVQEKNNMTFVNSSIHESILTQANLIRSEHMIFFLDDFLTFIRFIKSKESYFLRRLKNLF